MRKSTLCHSTFSRYKECLFTYLTLIHTINSSIKVFNNTFNVAYLKMILKVVLESGGAGGRSVSGLNNVYGKKKKKTWTYTQPHTVLKRYW